MINEELEALIREKYQKGERRDAIKASLIELGYAEADIDATIAHIQKDAIKQMPGISHAYKWIENLESKTDHANPKVVAGVLLASCTLVLIISVGLYMWLDPLGTKAVDRDKQRETDIIKIRSAIDSHFATTGTYPATLEALMPKYLQSIPLDPKSGAQYKYAVHPETSSFELCVSFEITSEECITSSPGENAIPQITEEPEEPFEPESEEPLEASAEADIIEDDLEPVGPNSAL